MANVSTIARAADPESLPVAPNPYYAKAAGIIQRVLPVQPNFESLRDEQHECCGVCAGFYIAGLISLEQWQALAREIAAVANRRLAELQGVATA
jgi:hypothetical protein